MVDARRTFGNAGENLASEFLMKKGYTMLSRQYRCHFGEIDLVCRDKEMMVFVEVKSRKSHEYGFPEEAVTPTKRSHLNACAQAYLDEHHLLDCPWRVDVIAIEFDEDPPRISHFEAIDR